MSEVLLASRREIAEAYQVALARGQVNEAAFWRAELLDRTVAIVNLITSGGTPEASKSLGEGE